ncbi:hypothetical protein Tco_0353099 [Tanacetum coccineum]
MVTITLIQKNRSNAVGSTSGIRACALRNFDLGTMELENSQNNALAKLPMLKLGEYEMWEIRIKQYFQIQDYALWEVIENGNLVSTGTTKVNTASTETSTASFSDATVYAFLSTQPQGSQLVHEDLRQIHDDDLDEWI